MRKEFELSDFIEGVVTIQGINCDLVERVKEVDQNDELYLQILNANPILEDRRNNDDLRTFLFNIFEQEYSNAGRRSKMHYAKEHEKFLKRYSTFDKYTYKKYLIKMLVKKGFFVIR